MKNRIINIGIVVLIFGTTVFGSELTINSVEEAVQIGLQSNPDYQSQLNVLQAKEAIPKKIGGLSDPTIGVRFNGAPAKNSDYSFDQKRYFVNQSFPFFGELGRKKRLGEKDIDLAKVDLELTRNTVSLMIQKIYFGLVLNQKLTEITRKNNQLLENIINIANIKYQSGKTLQANVLKAKVTKGKLEEQLLQLSHQKVMLTEELKKWLGVSASEVVLLKLGYPDNVSLAVSTVNSMVVSDSLVVQRSFHVRDKSAQKVAVEKDAFLPNFMTQVEVWDNSGMDTQYAAQVGMSIPWFSRKNYASVQEAKAMNRANDQLSQNSVNVIFQQLITWFSELQMTQKTIDLYDTQILKNAQLSLSSFQKAFEVDKVSFLDYFESEKTLYTLEMQYARLVNKKYVLYAQINALFADREEK